MALESLVISLEDKAKAVKLTSAGLVYVANKCEEYLRAENRGGLSKEGRQISLRYRHDLKDLLRQAKEGKSPNVTFEFRDQFEYLVNHSVEREKHRFSKLCGQAEKVLPYFVGGFFGAGKIEWGLFSAGVFGLICGADHFLATHTKESARLDAMQVMISDDKVWQQAINVISYHKMNCLNARNWYAR